MKIKLLKDMPIENVSGRYVDVMPKGTIATFYTNQKGGLLPWGFAVVEVENGIQSTNAFLLTSDRAEILEKD
jgi:nitrogen regulatory protein PII-like uncharacterized protein